MKDSQLGPNYLWSWSPTLHMKFPSPCENTLWVENWKEIDPEEELLQHVQKTDKILAKLSVDAKQPKLYWFHTEPPVLPFCCLKCLSLLAHSCCPGATYRIPCLVGSCLYLPSFTEKPWERNPPILLQALFSMFPWTCSNPPHLKTSQPLTKHVATAP